VLLPALRLPLARGLVSALRRQLSLPQGSTLLPRQAVPFLSTKPALTNLLSTARWFLKHRFRPSLLSVALALHLALAHAPQLAQAFLPVF
jgi:hypothetical protein